jgi:ABC-type Na+ efflux pump permease subunit
MNEHAILGSIATISALLATISIGVTMFEESAAQNATSIANQTAGAQLANLTQADFETLRENLASAREGLQGDENEAAFTALSSANNDLFGIIDSQGEDRIKALAGQLNPIQTSLDKAQDAIRNNDNSTALNALNSADTELLKLTQQLPADEDDDEVDEADEDDADTDEAGG